MDGQYNQYGNNGQFQQNSMNQGGQYGQNMNQGYGQYGQNMSPGYGQYGQNMNQGGQYGQNMNQGGQYGQNMNQGYGQYGQNGMVQGRPGMPGYQSQPGYQPQQGYPQPQQPQQLQQPVKKRSNAWWIILIVIGATLPVLAILAAAIAPAFIRYNLKSKIAEDIGTASTIRSAVLASVADEDIYNEIYANGGVKFTVDKNGPSGCPPKFLNEFKKNMNYEFSSPEYTKNGAEVFVVEVDLQTFEVTVSAGKKSGVIIAEISPNADLDYR
ncbi:MAG: hypothetical protein IJ619_05830 [Eubacterium sp.]|nr:hypothetical protein [Eubacterium sp.]